MQRSVSLSNKAFVDMASPHSWVVSADNLFEQAVHLYKSKGKSFIALRGENGQYRRWDAVDKAMFLLSGFALENVIKAYLVFENPTFVADGKLHYKLRSHRLVRLKRMSKLIPRPVLSEPIISVFEEGIETWSRYPCGLTAQQTQHQRWFTEELWQAYTSLMRRYGVHLKTILKRKWEGPDGQTGSWRFSDHPILDADFV